MIEDIITRDSRIDGQGSLIISTMTNPLRSQVDPLAGGDRAMAGVTRREEIGATKDLAGDERWYARRQGAHWLVRLSGKSELG